MALQKGTENKKQVAIFAGLLVILLVLGIIETRSIFAPSKPVPTTAAKPVAAAKPTTTTTPQPVRTSFHMSPEAQRLTNTGLDPTLYLEKLALTEQVLYSGAGRNIFSSESTPAPIEAPIKSARNAPKELPQPTMAPPKREAPKAPQIALKYFGYIQSHDKKEIKAYFLHGEEIYIARAGDLVENRYKVVSIQPGSAQVTDLNYNSTQNLPLMAN